MENREAEPKTQKVVAAVIYNRDRDSIWIAQRAKGKRFPGMWEFIGGKVEEGETGKDAIVREVEEEIGPGIDAVVGEPLGEAVFKADEGFNMQVTFRECKVDEDKINRHPDIHSQLKLIKIRDLVEIQSEDWVGANGKFAEWFVEYSKNRLDLVSV